MKKFFYFFFVFWIITRSSTTEVHLHTPPPSNPMYLPRCLSLSTSLSLLHKCQLPILKAFCADLWGSFYHSHYKSLTPVTLHCWYSSTIFYFVCFVTEYFGPGPRKCTLGLSRGLTVMKCELSPTGFATCCRPLQTGSCIPLFSLSELSDNFSPHIETADEKIFKNYFTRSREPAS